MFSLVCPSYILTFLFLFFISTKGQVVINRFGEQFSLPEEDLESIRERLVRVENYTRKANLNGIGHVKSVDSQRQILQQAAESNVSAECLNQTERMLNDLLAGKMYALQMLDAVGKPSAGILGGAVTWYGNYDGCLNITATGNEAGIQGQYCLVSAGGQTAPNPDPVNQPVISIRIGVCVPSACDANSTKALLDAGLFALQDLGITLDLKTTVACVEPVPYTAGDIVAFVVIGILVLLLLVGAIVDLVVRYNPEKVPGDKIGFTIGEKVEENGSLKIDHKIERERSIIVKILIAFSPITNGGKILTVGNVRGDIGCLHGLRLFSMWWVILGHTMVSSVMAISNPLDALKITKTFAFQAVGNATFSVDTFFLLSGLLLTFLVMKEINKSGWRLNWFCFYFHRFWRLTPLYAFVLLISMTLIKHISVGPSFVGQADILTATCDKYWWTNMLYINNFYPTSEYEICLLHTWYLANDMQFFIISPILLLVLSWNWIVGLGTLIGVMVSSMIFVGMFSTYWAIPAFPYSIAPPTPLHGLLRGGWDIIYDKPYCRIQSYVIGMMLGYALYMTDCKPIFRIKKIWIALAWILTAVLCLTVVYGTYWDIVDGVVLPLGVSSLYNCTARVAWCLCVCWVIFACVHGLGGPVNEFLSWSGFVPLSRLTYGAYLIHFGVMVIYLSRAREPIHFSYITLSYLIIGHVVFSYAVSFVLSLLVEAPMIGLEKVLFRRK